jgi:hypothetical protein
MKSRGILNGAFELEKLFGRIRLTYISKEWIVGMWVD